MWLLVPIFEEMSTCGGRLVQVIVSPGISWTLCDHESVKLVPPLFQRFVVRWQTIVRSVQNSVRRGLP
jgi:hypothetical protein